ncbi:MAG TPA: hypothetical protein VI306_23800, partial [Pyrinomonadaceae bacterium]
MVDLVATLSELGYTFVSNPKFATESLRLELALREFQTYAKLQFVAQVDNANAPYYGAKLKSVEVP